MSQSASRSASRSPAGSRSSSRSSSNSMKLPEPAPPVENGSTAVAAAAYPSSQEAAREVASLFIGLGPEGRSVKADELLDLLRSKALNPANIHDIRLRGRCAFADTTTVEEARHLIAELDNSTFKETIRLSVQMSKQTLSEAQQKRKEREETRVSNRSEVAANGGCQVFINLGPKGGAITDDTLRARIEKLCPIIKMERRGYCVYVDVHTPADTQKVVADLNDTVIEDVRLVAMVSMLRRKRERETAARRGERSPRRDDRRDVLPSSRRRRSGSRDGGRRDRRRTRRSYTPSSRSSSRSHSRGRRSYSSESVDSRERRREGRRGRRDDRRDDRRGDRRDDRRGDRRDDRRGDRRDDRRGDRRDRR
ncbi:splicing factor ptsr1-like protein [Leptomonas pyrrhocoris]|uniref:Splicing factor ptsr1-like protein n=1 Tax=Leptomonas pyrrhocoris TaxID=157538 RepID=A0A0M9FQZ8_LEPPY|nr:splicing factor ptsr1-like protein [Leptomonas pyrrhocoris]KPA74275.1 splicing factor ptsr1-like protein [Leptomonas pyrrhocoris]|eukprot:XP_015652714.1 splicing factor ptsr1-like protein [Leptomonas pyrrhocoris]